MKRIHVYISLLSIATFLLVACSEPTKDKGSTTTPPTKPTTPPTKPTTPPTKPTTPPTKPTTPPTKPKPASPPSVRKFLHTLSKSIEEIEKGRINPQTWQAEIKNLLQQLKKKPKYKHKPTTKKELIVLIKAEIWAQGTGGTPNYKADLNNIDTSLIIDMSYLFSKTKGYGLPQFSGNIKDWNVSSVINMHGMFYGAVNFDGDIRNWDVSRVTDMGNMFAGAKVFNQSLNQWKVSSVTSLVYMFYNAFSFNQDLDDWDEHLKNTDDTYRKVNTQDMFKNSGINALPRWLARIPT